MSDADIDVRWRAITSELTVLKSEIAHVDHAMKGAVAIFGAGQYGVAALKYLTQLGANVVCLVDNHPDKQGCHVDGYKIVSPQEMLALSPSIVFIAARHAILPIRNQLRVLNVQNISLDTYALARRIRQLEDIRSIFVNEDKSCVVFDAIVNTMLTGNEAYCEHAMDGDQNFALPRFMNTGMKEHFVDAGAFVGDTLERFIWSNNGVFEKIYAFEPGAPQYNALTKRVERLANEWALEESKFDCINAALGDCNKEVMLSASFDMIQTTLVEDRCSSDETIPMITLDSFLSNRPATFIKADIEGMELRMLQGARETIQKFKPKLAISVYHNTDDLFEIPLYLKSIVPEYKMALRQHAPILMDTVLYCWVEDEGV